MKTQVYYDDFVRLFNGAGRERQFSRDALHALFEYLVEREEESGIEEDLEIVGLCCEYTEMDEKTARNEHDIPDDEDWIAYFRGQTTVIEVDDDLIIIQNF